MYGSRDAALFLARLILGFIFVMHGWQKLHTNGISNVEKGFDAMGIPAPGIAAQYSTWVELLGGIFLIIGLLLPIVSLLLILNMLGAIWYAHWDSGFWNSDGGYELPLALIAGLLAVGLSHAGRAAADHYIMRRRGVRVD
ncbi:DoxX family protein [Nocardia jiangsuensis]|uniref:DoxX family protein n=1 Tax=Nocardia jiangsuensis TaxID=1691563 RepID=A0ABV8DRY7_9NOCA